MLIMNPSRPDDIGGPPLFPRLRLVLDRLLNEPVQTCEQMLINQTLFVQVDQPVLALRTDLGLQIRQGARFKPRAMRRDIVARHHIDTRPWVDPQAKINGTLSNNLDAIGPGGARVAREGAVDRSHAVAQDLNVLASSDKAKDQLHRPGWRESQPPRPRYQDRRTNERGG